MGMVINGCASLQEGREDRDPWHVKQTNRIISFAFSLLFKEEIALTSPKVY